MNAKHTRYREVKANDDTGRWEVFQHDVDGSRCWLATFESESWAYEFASAPDLLEACEAALTAFRRMYHDIEKGTIDTDDLMNDETYWPLTSLRDSIAKAKGE